MKTPGKFLSSPFFLSAIPLVIVIILTAGRFNRFSLETESAVILPKGQNIFFDDLDGDGVSESLYAFSQENTTALAIRKNLDILDQWNFNGTFDFYLKKCLFITGDRDDNGKKEVYVFTLNADSILLHCVSDFSDSEAELTDRFVVKVGPGLRNPDPFIIPAEMQDLDDDGIKELIFGVTTGFSEYPRNVFAYFIMKDSLVMSPESSYFISGIVQYDMTGDGKKEIIPHGYATGNVESDEALFHDHSSYFMVLNQDLDFLFQPVEFKEENSAVIPFYDTPEGDSLFSFFFSPRLYSENSVINRINSQGVIVDTFKVGFHVGNCWISTAKNGHKNYLMQGASGSGLLIYDHDFNLKKIIPGNEQGEIKKADIDHDGRNELIVADFSKGELIVYREELKHPVSGEFITEGSGTGIFSFNKNVIAVQSGQQQYLFRYRQHPWYPYFYLVYPLLYAAMIGIFITIRTIRRQVVYDNERRISQLQLTLLKNQLDPHFTLNAINSIIYSAEFSDRAKTGDQLRAFAGLFRNMLMSSAAVQKTIKEELDFCRNYLALEKMRFGNGFSYEIHVYDDVNMDLMIPKFSIQIHAENALKHGLSGVAEGGKLKILLKSEGSHTIIEVSDNGTGRVNSNNETRDTTGKGLAIMEELYRIYNRYYDEKISFDIIDLYNIENKPSGTLVRISVKQQSTTPAGRKV